MNWADIEMMLILFTNSPCRLFDLPLSLAPNEIAPKEAIPTVKYPCKVGKVAEIESDCLLMEALVHHVRWPYEALGLNLQQYRFDVLILLFCMFRFSEKLKLSGEADIFLLPGERWFSFMNIGLESLPMRGFAQCEGSLVG